VNVLAEHLVLGPQPQVLLLHSVHAAGQLLQGIRHRLYTVWSSVPDPEPNPDPPDPHVLGHPGSGSGFTSQRYGSGSGSSSSKNSKKNDVNLPSKSNRQKNLFKKICFLFAS
jgi:hypothetical protein